MGSWSVYCGISRITITSGRECVFLPLIENKTHQGYDKYIPATLPIFGEYNDYGGIENIVQDKNVKLIEKIYNCSIDDFCAFLTDVRRDYGDDYSDWHGKENLKELENFKYMWIDREVWNYLVSYHPNGYGRTGDFDMGNPSFLKALGFEYIGKTKNKRYTDHYRYTNGDTLVNIQSDGTWCHLLNNDNSGLYRINDFKILGVDTTKFDGKEEQNAFEIFDDKTRIQKLGWVVGIERTYVNELEMEEMYAKLDENVCKEIEEKEKKRTDELKQKMKKQFGDEYKESDLDAIFTPVTKRGLGITHVYAKLIKDNDFICSTMADMVTLKHNMYCASTSWEPYIFYITPQCGEHAIHQKMLEAFAKINRDYLTEIGYDENEDEDGE